MTAKEYLSQARLLDARINAKIQQVSALNDLATHATTEYQLLLEKRYLCFMPWEKIAVDMGYSIQHIYRLHDWALREFPVPQET